MYLRFIKGVVTLTICHSTYHVKSAKDPNIDAMRSALTKRVLDMLDKMAKKEQKYAEFWTEFPGEEGPAEALPTRRRSPS